MEGGYACIAAYSPGGYAIDPSTFAIIGEGNESSGWACGVLANG